MKLTNKLNEVTRRSFLKGMAAIGATGVIAGCSKSDDGAAYLAGDGRLPGSQEAEDLSDLSSFDKFWAACPHNCGASGRCVNTVWVKNGRIKRVTSDDFESDNNGNTYNKEAINDPRRLSCAKGRAYKYRAYHNGRLKYPMKQTKARGDLTGFVRISWEEAYDEVLRKYWAIYSKYGSAAIQFNNGPAGYAGTGVSAANPTGVITSGGGTRATYSDHSFHQYNYGRQIAGVPNSLGYSSLNMGAQLNAVAHGRIKNWVSFGTNSMTTNNSMSYVYLKANQEGKRLNSDFKHYIISPELTDTGVICATDWVQIRNQTDPALIAGMIYHLIDETFDKTTGLIKQNHLLDVDYIDTVLHGFFDSPAYWVNTTGTGGVKGEISLDPKTDTVNWRKINEVPAGRSYASWIMGSDDRLARAYYNEPNNTKGKNYTAKKFANGRTDVPRAAKCSMLINGNPAHSNTTDTAYYTKKDYLTPKSPEWAEKITGIPAQTIRDLAELYAKEENKPILTEWTGGLQKSENGVITLYAIQTLFAVTKNWGWSYGSTGSMFQTWATNIAAVDMGTAEASPVSLPSMPAVSTSGLTSNTGSTVLDHTTVPAMSIAEHHQGLYFAFKEDLDKAGFTGAANPEWDGSSRYLFGAAAAKAQVLYKRTSTGTGYEDKTITLKDGTTRTYCDWATDSDGNPIFTGKRFYLGAAGTNMNGVGNTNWAAEIMRLLPLASVNPDDPDTFCMATFDFHMSTQAMFADYVFPLANSLEGYDSTSFGATAYGDNSSSPIRSFTRPAVITPPGEAMDAWDATYTGWKQRVKTLGTAATFKRIDGANDIGITNVADAALKVIGQTGAGYYVSHSEKYKKSIQDAINKATPGDILYGLTPEQAIGKQIRPVTQKATNTDPGAPTKNTLWTNLDDYLNGRNSFDPANDPFITFASNRQFTPQINNALIGFTAEAQAEIPTTTVLTEARHGTIDANLGRMTCFAEYAVLAWERGHDIYHGWLPEEERGGRKKDYEGDPFIYPIPMYYDFRDAFNEMYGVFNPNPARRNFNAGWKMIGAKPATNDISLIKDKLTVTVGSTHDRFRSHSSTAENPLTRELNCRTKGGGWASGNDWNEYGVIPEATEIKTGDNVGMTPMRSKAIQKKNMKTASWHEFWLNDEDAAEYGIKDGDIIRISNPIGAIRCSARVTARIVRGHGQIHHGAWYDPNPVDGVDDGACANTLMSNRPSKLDYGNSVHCAYCVVEKETKY